MSILVLHASYKLAVHVCMDQYALLSCNDTVVSLAEAPYTQTGVQDSKGLISAFLPLILSTLLFNSLHRISELSTYNPCT